MTSPRQILALVAAAFLGIGYWTFRFPPQFLALSGLWCALAVLAGISCLAAAIRPRRLYVATSGATVVTVSAARGFALVIEWANAEDDLEAGYIVGVLTWWTLALLVYVVWREYVSPWAVGKRQGNGR